MASTTVVNLVQSNPVIINVRQGNTILLPLIWQDELGVALDFTGYTATGQLRTDYVEDGGEIIVDLTEVPDADNNYLTLTPATGTVEVRIDQSVTAALSSRSRYFLEVKLESGLGNITVGLVMRIKFKKDVAR